MANHRIRGDGVHTLFLIIMFIVFTIVAILTYKDEKDIKTALLVGYVAWPIGVTVMLIIFLLGISVLLLICIGIAWIIKNCP